MSMGQFDRLLAPGRIGGLDVRNRVVMAPMGTSFANPDGTVSPRLKRYYEDRARGGVGLVIVEGTAVDPARGRLLGSDLFIDDDRYVDGLAELAAVIHRPGGTSFGRHGAAAAIQLAHGGAASEYQKRTGGQIVGPSAAPAYTGGEVPVALDQSEIARIVEAFALAARRAQRAGFDAVELHGAHGYLISEFLSPLYNKRSDEYGGSLTARAKFLLDIVKAIKLLCGARFPVIVRVNGEECEEGGVKVEDTVALARLLEAAGADALDISYGTHFSREPLAVAPACYPQGVLTHLAAAVKQGVGIPVIAVGRILRPDYAQQVLASGAADFVALGRALLADPQWARKTASGRADDIVPCLGCMECLNAVMYHLSELKCGANAALGVEADYDAAAMTRKKVVVVGGGPAGMQASIVAASRGHEVSLFERAAELGGQLIAGSKPPHKEDLARLTASLAGRMRDAGVTVRAGQEATPDGVLSLRPDVVIVATGGQAFVPDIPGIDGQNVVRAEDVLAGKDTGARVVVVGGELVGCETAEYLADRGKQVTVVRRGKRVAASLTPIVRAALLRRLRQKGVQQRAGVQGYQEINERGLVVTNEDGKPETIAANTIVLAAGSRPNNTLLARLEGRVGELYAVGDCVEPRNIMNAIHEGSGVGLRI